PTSTYLMGEAVETKALTALERWQHQLGPRETLLRRALQDLQTHECQVPPFSDTIKTEYLLYANILLTPPDSWSLPLPASDPVRRILEFTSTAEQAPWEKERVSRILNAVFAGWLRSARTDYWETSAAAGGRLPADMERTQMALG